MTLLLNQAYSQFAIPKELQLFDNNPNQLVAQNQYYSVIKPKSALSTANDIVFQFATNKNQFFEPSQCYIQLVYNVTKKDGLNDRIEKLSISKIFMKQYKNAKPQYFEHYFTVWNGYCIADPLY